MAKVLKFRIVPRSSKRQRITSDDLCNPIGVSLSVERRSGPSVEIPVVLPPISSTVLQNINPPLPLGHRVDLFPELGEKELYTFDDATKMIKEVWYGRKPLHATAERKRIRCYQPLCLRYRVSFISAAEKKKHEQEVHMNMLRVYKCSKCVFGGRTSEELADHFAATHNQPCDNE